MRVTLGTRYDTTLRQIFRNREEVAHLTEDIASGQRLHRPSDDPLDWAGAADLDATVRQMKTFQSNLDFAVSWNSHTEDALNELNDLLIKAKDLGIRSISSDSEANVPDLNQVINEAVRVANTKFGDSYVFGGDGNGDTAPFTVTRDTDGNVTAVSDFTAYQASDDWKLEVRVGKSDRETVNIDGRAVFLEDRSATASPDNNIFQHLVAMKDAMESGDTDAIGEELDAIDKARERVLDQASVVGSHLNSFTRQKDMLTQILTDVQGRLSEYRDTNMAETITHLQTKQTVLQAAFSTASMLKDLNLYQYL